MAGCVVVGNAKAGGCFAMDGAFDALGVVADEAVGSVHEIRRRRVGV